LKNIAEYALQSTYAILFGIEKKGIIEKLGVSRLITGVPAKWKTIELK
jgi:hypothetical protein